MSSSTCIHRASNKVNSKIDSADLVLGEVISDLVRDISKFPHVLQVRAISRYLDGRWIDFQILHDYSTEWDYILPEDIQSQIFDLVFDACSELRDMTGNKYYFDHIYYYGQLPSIPEPEVNQVVADSLGVNNDNH